MVVTQKQKRLISVRKFIRKIFSLQCVGTGKLRPNTVIMGFKSNWRTAPGAEIEEYVDVIQ